MAQHVEPMDIDSDFDNKENSLHHNNVLPFTEKGYEELDVSELNMKLRYSITPASSPMSKSYTANCVDNRSLDSDDTLNVTINENGNLTRSLNSNLSKNDSIVKSLKALPLQTISTEQFVDNNISSVLRTLDTTITEDNANVTVTVSGPGDMDENLLSSSSSTAQTPEAITPTKDTKNDGGSSPIMRGLKTVLNMFRSSQSPIPPAESGDTVKPELLSPAEPTEEMKVQSLLASTPISAHRKKEMSPTKRSSPNKDSIVFNDDLEKELQWKDETTIIFSQERIPIHKLFYQQPTTEKKGGNVEIQLPTQVIQDDLNSTVEYMDISYNDSIRDKTVTDIQVIGNKTDGTITVESDGEFVDCETTFTKNDSLLEDKDKTPVNDKMQDSDITKDVETNNENTSATRIKQIILNTTQDILDATLSITPEDLIPGALIKTENVSCEIQSVNIETNLTQEINLEESNATLNNVQENLTTSLEQPPVLNQTVDSASPSVDAPLDNLTQPTFNQTVEISSIIEHIENPNVTKSIENDSVQHIIEELDSTAVAETTFCTNNKTIEDQLKTLPTVNNDTILNDKTQDIELNKQDITTENNNEHTTSNINENATTISNIGNLEETLNMTVSKTEYEVDSSPVKEASITEIAAEIPLPDEDDIEKEFNITTETTDASAAPTGLPLDFVDSVKTNTDVPETDNYKEEIEHDVMTNVPQPLANTLDSEGDKTQNELLLDTVTTNTIAEVSENVKKEMLPITEGAPVVDSGILPETPLLLNNYVTEIENQLHENLEVINKKESVADFLNATVTNYFEGNHGQEFPMDINDSVILSKPLPDVINQTSIIANVDLEFDNNTPQVISQETVTLPENIANVTNEVKTEIVPEVTGQVPELLSDAHVVDKGKPANELNNIITETKELSAVPTSLDTTTGPISNVTESCAVGVEPVPKGAQLSHLDVIPVESAKPENEQPLTTDDAPVSENTDMKTTDDEIILSENNSPFVSVIAEDIPEIKPEDNVEVQNIEPLETAGKLVFTPPASPPIASKGYNFNFDEIDDPFATKTKIRISPSMDTPTKTVEIKAGSKSVVKAPGKKEANNRRKSQPERKKPIVPKRKINSTFSGAISNETADKPIEIFAVGDMNLEQPPKVALDPSNVTIDEDKLIQEAKLVHEKTLTVAKEVQEEIKPDSKIEHIDITSSSEVIEIEPSPTIPAEDLKITSSSELSAYYSAGTSSNESIHSRNVFNLPEIDDRNFNPFATKSKMRQSPPPIPQENPFATKSKIRNSAENSMISSENYVKVDNLDVTKTVSDDKMETESMEKDASGNLSNTTTSSKATDERNATIKEIHTEDEDTVEGPFLEAEDLNTDDKMSDFDGENIDMMQFSELPAQANEENLDNGELFIDAEAFEFLLNQNKSNTVVDSGKESLFLKFDPLFAKRMSSITPENLVASLNKIQKRQSTPTKSAMPQKEFRSPIAGPSNLNITQDMDMSHNLSEEFNEDLNITVSKPMMVVPPAVNPVTPRNKSLTPNRSNRRSFTFTSPAMAVIDRLLSLSGNSSLVHDSTVTQPAREHNEADLALTQLRELLAEKEVHVYSLRSESKELKDRLTSLESHLKSLEDESKDRLQKINDLNDRLVEKTKINKSMAAVVEEYERTIASLISETAQDKKRHAEERIKLINERDEQTAHLASMEVSFSDLHSKYEKSKQVILNCKANEETYKKSIKEFEENLTKMQNNYELLKQHATSKLNHANQELEKMNRTHEAEVLKLNAMIKRKELHITSLEESLAQKTKANEELTAICDELINKVG